MNEFGRGFAVELVDSKDTTKVLVIPSFNAVKKTQDSGRTLFSDVRERIFVENLDGVVARLKKNIRNY